MVILRTEFEAQAADLLLEVDAYARYVTRRGTMRCTVVGGRGGRKSRIAV